MWQWQRVIVCVCALVLSFPVLCVVSRSVTQVSLRGDEDASHFDDYDDDEGPDAHAT